MGNKLQWLLRCAWEIGYVAWQDLGLDRVGTSSGVEMFGGSAKSFVSADIKGLRSSIMLRILMEMSPRHNARLVDI
jgi:hypothetical protein